MQQFSLDFFWHRIHNSLGMEANNKHIIGKEAKDDFSMGATIAVSTLLLAFIGSSFYVLLTSYFELI